MSSLNDISQVICYLSTALSSYTGWSLGSKDRVRTVSLNTCYPLPLPPRTRQQAAVRGWSYLGVFSYVSGPGDGQWVFQVPGWDRPYGRTTHPPSGPPGPYGGLRVRSGFVTASVRLETWQTHSHKSLTTYICIYIFVSLDECIVLCTHLSSPEKLSRWPSESFLFAMRAAWGPAPTFILSFLRSCTSDASCWSLHRYIYQVITIHSIKTGST